MKIAHIHWSLATGGIETMLPDIVNEQAKEEVVALFIVNNKIENTILSKINKTVKVFLIGRTEGSKNPWPLIKLNALLLKFNPDIIHTHAYKQSKLIWFKNNCLVRTIHNVHNNPLEYKKYKRLFAISETVKEYTEKQGYKSIVISNGIPIRQINNKVENKHNDGKIHAVQVSRLYSRQKGQDILINAIGILAQRGTIRNFIMHFIGSGDSLKTLQSLVIKNNLQDIIIFEGNKEQNYLYKNLCKYDLFIQPSNYEGFGLTVAEAAAAKLPIIISNIDGPMEILNSGKYGMTFEVGNVEDLANKIQQFIDGNYDYSLIDKAYNYVKSNYDVSVTAKKYIEEYKKILSSKHE